MTIKSYHLPPACPDFCHPGMVDAMQIEGLKYEVEPYEMIVFSLLDEPSKRRALRQIGETLSAMHRAGHCYGALDQFAIVKVGNDFKLHRLPPHPGQSPSIQNDCRDFARLIQSLLPANLLPRRALSDQPGPYPTAATLTRYLNPQRRFFKRILLAASIFFAVGIGYSVSNPTVHQGYELLRTAGAKAAYEFFAQFKHDPRERFALGWAAFRNEKYEEAREIANLEISEAKGKGRADGYYLLGYIADYEGNYAQAVSHFKSALAIYAANGLEEESHLTSCALARLALDEHLVGVNPFGLEDAEFYLGQAALFEQPTAHYFHLNARFAFMQENLRDALEFSYQEIETAHSAPSDLIEAMSDAGFYLMLLGDFENGLTLTQRAELLIVKTGDERKYYFNLLNEYLYAKCSGITTLSIQNMLEQYIGASGDRVLAALYRRIEDMACAQHRPGASDPPPPPPPAGFAGIAAEGDLFTNLLGLNYSQRRPGASDPPPPPPPAGATSEKREDTSRPLANGLFRLPGASDPPPPPPPAGATSEKREDTSRPLANGLFRLPGASDPPPPPPPSSNAASQRN